MEWLRIQLQILRDRGMKAILMGHVPPARVDSKESWDETCWQKYTLWVRQYRDVIVGSLYGHMNIDHFMLQDFEQIAKDTENGRMASGASPSAKLDTKIELLEDGEVTVASASDYLINLRQLFARLPAPPTKSNKKSRSKSVWNWLSSKVPKPADGSPGKSAKREYLDKIGGKFAERYAVTHVAPSVVPNYFPTLRIIEYNITGLEHLSVSGGNSDRFEFEGPNEQLLVDHDELSDDEGYLRDVATTLRHRKKHKGKKNQKGPRKYKFKVPEGPSKSTPPGPAYSPQSLTWTRYVQYFANLTNINNDFVDPQPDQLDRFKSTEGKAISNNDLSPHTIFGLQVSPDGELENKRWKEGKHGKHQGKRPKDKPHPKEFVYEVEYDTKDDKGFADLTVRRWVEYARKIGQAGAKAEEVEEEVDESNYMSDEQDLEESENPAVETSGKNKHKKHKKGKHHKTSREWFTFVKRAFVGTMDPHDIEDLFGAQDAHVDAVHGVEASEQEIMEL
jgi:endopolyphosphatase